MPKGVHCSIPLDALSAPNVALSIYFVFYIICARASVVRRDGTGRFRDPSSLVVVMRLAPSTLLALLLPAVSTAAAIDSQLVLSPAPIMDDFTRTETQPSLSDLLTLQSRVSIFHSYLRELEDLNSRIAGLEGVNTTLLVPTNKAVMALPRKPCVSRDPQRLLYIDCTCSHLPADDKENMPVISEQQAHDESQAILHRWIAAHIIPVCERFPPHLPQRTHVYGRKVSPISFDATYPTLLDGVSVSFEKTGSGNTPSDYAVKANGRADAHIIDVKEVRRPRSGRVQLLTMSSTRPSTVSCTSSKGRSPFPTEPTRPVHTPRAHCSVRSVIIHSRVHVLFQAPSIELSCHLAVVHRRPVSMLRLLLSNITIFDTCFCAK